MPYTNCSVCGAKALVGATRCPRCQAPFVSYDPGGDRVETVNCPKCGVQRPVAIGVCPNCLTSTAPSGLRMWRGLVVASVAVVALMAVGYAISRRTGQTRPLPDTTPDTAVVAAPVDSQLAADSTPRADTNTGVASGASAQTVPIAGQGTARPTALAAAAPTPATTAPAAPAPPALKPAPLPAVAVPDTGTWEYATAKTWVRVRSAPTLDSEVLRMVDSAQRVRLGPPQNGWRSIRVGVDRGWVDPRFFTVVGPARP